MPELLTCLNPLKMVRVHRVFNNLFNMIHMHLVHKAVHTCGVQGFFMVGCVHQQDAGGGRQPLGGMIIQILPTRIRTAKLMP